MPLILFGEIGSWKLFGFISLSWISTHTYVHCCMSEVINVDLADDMTLLQASLPVCSGGGGGWDSVCNPACTFYLFSLR